MTGEVHDLYLQQGKTQPIVLRCETDVIVYRAITLISQTAPVRITVPGHNLTAGWRAAVTNVKGMVEINGAANRLRPSDYHGVVVVDDNTIEFNDVDAAGFKAYISGGYLQYNMPMDLTGYSARLQIRNKKNGGTLLFEMTTDNGLIAIDTSLNTVTLYLDAIDFTTLTWERGYHELELFKNVTRGTQTVEIVYSPIEGNVFLDVETAK